MRAATGYLERIIDETGGYLVTSEVESTGYRIQWWNELPAMSVITSHFNRIVSRLYGALVSIPYFL